LSVETIKELICEGVARLGLDEVRRVDERHRELNRLHIDRWSQGVATPAADAELRRLWPSPARISAARGVVYHLVCARLAEDRAVRLEPVAS
jgi:hypothetical protein